MPALSAPTAPPAPVAPAAAPPAAAPAPPAAPPKATPSPADAPPAMEADNPFDIADKQYEERIKAAEQPEQDKGEDKPAEDKEQEPAVPAKPADEKEKRRIEPKELRAQLDKTVSELKTKSSQITALETKIKEFEKSGQSTAALTEKLAQREQELEAMKGELSASAFKASGEYEKQFKKPFDKAAGYAKRLVEQLETAQIENEDGSLVAARPATWDDFVALYRLPINQATAQARKLFGDQSQLVINQLTELQRLDWQSQEALAEEKKDWEGKQTTRTAEAAKQKEAISKMWMQVNEGLAEKFAVKPEDKALADLQQEGYRIVDSRHNHNGMTLHQRVLLDATVRHRAANYAVEKQARESAEKQRDEWKAKYEELKKSGPGQTMKQGIDGHVEEEQSDREELAGFLPKIG